MKNLSSSLTCASLSALVFFAIGCGADGGSVSGADAGPTADAADGVALNVPKLYINEVVAKAIAAPGPNPTGSDWLELYNGADVELDLAGYRLIDSAKKPFSEALPLPTGTKIGAKGFLVVFFNAEGNGTPVIEKGLGKDEAASLYHPDGLLLDRVNWEEGDSPEGASWGRFPDGASVIKTLAKPTPGAPNE